MAGVTHTYALQIKDQRETVVATDTTIPTGDIEIEFSDTVAGTGGTTRRSRSRPTRRRSPASTSSPTWP